MSCKCDVYRFIASRRQHIVVEYKGYYAVIGGARDAGQDEIKGSYRKLGRNYYPDVSSEPDAENYYKKVGKAYEVLKDSVKRAASMSAERTPLPRL